MNDHESVIGFYHSKCKTFDVESFFDQQKSKISNVSTNPRKHNLSNGRC